MGWRELLGFSTDNLPFDCVVEYDSGTKGRIPIFAKNGRDALIQVSKLIPVQQEIHKLTISRRIVNFEGPKDAA